MIVYTRAKIEKLLKIDFVRFCIVGGVGFLINLAILMLLTKLFHVHVIVAQFVGAEVALASNFFMHHHWTYKSKKVKKTIASLILQFHATSWPAIIGSVAMVGVGVSIFHLSKPLALVVSSLIALLWNFVWSKFVIWRNVTEKQIEEIAR